MNSPNMLYDNSPTIILPYKTFTNLVDFSLNEWLSMQRLCFIYSRSASGALSCTITNNDNDKNSQSMQIENKS